LLLKPIANTSSKKPPLPKPNNGQEFRRPVSKDANRNKSKSQKPKKKKDLSVDAERVAPRYSVPQNSAGNYFKISFKN
jgi:hypothetical protein